MLSLRNQVLRQEGVNSVPDKGGMGGVLSGGWMRRELIRGELKGTPWQGGGRGIY